MNVSPLFPVIPAGLSSDELDAITRTVEKYERITEFWQPVAEPWPEPDVEMTFRLRKADAGKPMFDEGIYMFYRRRPDGSLVATLTPVQVGYATPGPGWVCVRMPNTKVEEGPSQPGLYRFCQQRWDHDQMVMTVRDHGGRYRDRAYKPDKK